MKGAARAGLAASLWQANQDLAMAARRHPFVRGLEAGDLAAEAFRFYVGQDAFFLRSFARAYALAVARVPDLDGMQAFARLLQGALDELQLHRRYAAELGVDLAAAQPGAATRAYTDFLLRTAWERTPGEVCAAMTPCMRLYAFLGQELARSGPHAHRYADWIATYSSADFIALAETLEGLLDRFGSQETAADPYRYAMQLEVDFFTGALQQR